MKMILVFPAQAGVILKEENPMAKSLSFPRASGGDPTDIVVFESLVRFSPRKRGGSQLRAQAMDRAEVFPAQAGVILEQLTRQLSLLSFPRASGGDPILLSRGAGVVLFSPRKRG